MKKFFVSAAVAAVVVTVAGCAAPLVDKTGPLRIDTVSVETPADIQTASNIGPALERRASAEIVRQDPSGAPVDARIHVDGVSYKNPIASILVGSANVLATTVTINDKRGNAIETFDFAETDGAAINGVLGAAIAVGQDRTKVDQRLVEGYARNLRARIYGANGHVAKAPRQDLPEGSTQPHLRPTPPSKRSKSVPTS